MKTKWHTIQYSISSTKYFNNQRDMGEWLGINSYDKKSITKHCIKQGYGVTFDDYFGEHNVEFK